MNVLFVCTLNVARSVTAERMYRGTPGMSVRSAGTSERARRHVSATDVSVDDEFNARSPDLLAALRDSLVDVLGQPGGAPAPD